MKPQPLTDEQMKIIWNLSEQHPRTYTRGTWYPAIMAGKPVEIRRTKAGKYLAIRKPITVHLKTTDGEIINTRQEYEYFTVNLSARTMTAQGW